MAETITQTTHIGEEGKVRIETTHAATSPTVVAAVVTELCVTGFDYTETRKGVGSTTSCNYDEDDDTVYEDETEVSRRLDGSFTAYTTDEVDEQLIFKGQSFGPMTLVDYDEHGVYIPKARVKSFKKLHPQGALQAWTVEWHSKGKYFPGVAAPDDTP